MMNPLRVEFNRMIEKINELLDENDILRSRVNEIEFNKMELDQLITDEDFVMGKKSESVLEKVDERLIKEFNLTINPSDKKALVIFMMDCSGSMGMYEKYIARCFYERLERLFSRKYKDIQFKFIQHHVSATEAKKEEFFTKGESGGTIASSAFKMANDMVEKFDYIDNDVYLFHISDGDNLTSDNERTLKLIQKMLLKTKFVGYLETNQYSRHSTLTAIMKHISSPNYRRFVIREQVEVYDALKVMTPVIFG